MSAAKKNSPERGISPISKEEFLRDFLSLPIMHRGIFGFFSLFPLAFRKFP